MLFEQIQNYLQKPMVERSMGSEIIGCLFIFFVMALIWLIGQVIYQIEEKVGKNKWKRK